MGLKQLIKWVWDSKANKLTDKDRIESLKVRNANADIIVLTKSLDRARLRIEELELKEQENTKTDLMSKGLEIVSNIFSGKDINVKNITDGSKVVKDLIKKKEPKQVEKEIGNSVTNEVLKEKLKDVSLKELILMQKLPKETVIKYCNNELKLNEETSLRAYDILMALKEEDLNSSNTS